MKKVFLVIAICLCMVFVSVKGYPESGKPIEYQTEIFVQSTNLP